jgi:hypothetical protein
VQTGATAVATGEVVVNSGALRITAAAAEVGAEAPVRPEASIPRPPGMDVLAFSVAEADRRCRP